MLPGWGQVVTAWICKLIYECAYVELQVCVWMVLVVCGYIVEKCVWETSLD